MVARAEGDKRVLVSQEKVFADEEAADEEARSTGGVVTPLPVARDYRRRNARRGGRPRWPEPRSSAAERGLVATDPIPVAWGRPSLPIAVPGRQVALAGWRRGWVVMSR
jgi:hypothetical protein